MPHTDSSLVQLSDGSVWQPLIFDGIGAYIMLAAAIVGVVNVIKARRYR